jgi:predicted dienelactone hydrolase
MNDLVKDASLIPVGPSVPAISLSRVTLPAPMRGRALELRVTAPLTGDALPIILLSHGHGPSLYLPSKDGYGPLVSIGLQN